MSTSNATSRLRLASSRSYRSNGVQDSDVDRRALRHLSDATEALNMAVLVLDRGVDETREQKFARVTRGRELLVEAVTALSHARIFVAGVLNYDLPVLMTGEQDPEAELSRLHHIATRLAWCNHEHLPRRDQGAPLSAEDEAQLEHVYRGLTVKARLEHLARHRWWGIAALCTVATPWLGWAVGTIAMVSAVVGTWRSLAPTPEIGHAHDGPAALPAVAGT